MTRSNGSIRQIGNGWRWRYFYRDAAGRRCSKSGRATTKREASDEMAVSMAETIRTGRNATTSITVADYATEWIAGYELRGLRESTVYATRLTIATHIVARLGSMRLTDLKTRDVSAWIADLARDGRRDGRGGLAAKTIRNAYAVLASMLGDAAANDLISRNPCDGVRLPRVDKPVLAVWDRWQLAQFLATARDTGDPMYPIWRLIADTGMRRGEVLGLTWDQIDTMAYEVGVVATRVTVGGRMADSTPKTRAGRRRITVAADTIDALTRLRERQEAAAAALEMPPTRYVCSFDDGRPMSRAAFARRWAAAVKRAGVPYASPHKARHTVPTVMLEDGAPIHIVAGRMGHSSGAVTLKMYAEYLPRADRDAAAAWANALGDAMRDASACADRVPSVPNSPTLTGTPDVNIDANRQ